MEIYGGWVERGQFRGENLVFQFGVEIFLRNLGHFLLVGILSGASASFSMESQPGPCSVFYL